MTYLRNFIRNVSEDFEFVKEGAPHFGSSPGVIDYSSGSLHLLECLFSLRDCVFHLRHENVMLFLARNGTSRKLECVLSLSGSISDPSCDNVGRLRGLQYIEFDYGLYVASSPVPGVFVECASDC